MGMYNTVFCDDYMRGPMPKQDCINNAFQTKSISPNNLDFYYMVDGHLYLLKWSEDFELGKPGAAKDIDWFRNNMDKLTKSEYTGPVFFYGDMKGHWKGEWVEYLALYENGERTFCTLIRFGDMMLHNLVRFEE